jgi:uncharacterized protein (TIGR00369 family)
MNDAPLTPVELERVEGALARVPFARLLGISLGEFRRGEATLHMDARPELMQNNGIMHGGAIASLLDTATAFAILTLLNPDQTTATVELTIHYLRPILHGKVTAHARVLRSGRRLATITVDVTNGAGELAATAITTYAKTTYRPKSDADPAS